MKSCRQCAGWDEEAGQVVRVTAEDPSRPKTIDSQKTKGGESTLRSLSTLDLEMMKLQTNPRDYIIRGRARLEAKS